MSDNGKSSDATGNSDCELSSRVRPRAKPQRHLINLVSRTCGKQPCFALLLGAGASVTSGIKPARQMIEEWRQDYHRNHGLHLAKDVFLKAQPWFDRPEEYSTLFEAIYDQPSQRRHFIEKCIDGSSPSWGYIYLVNLIRKGVFNTIFTTNFDDLINEACYLFSSNLRPIVCSHDSSIRSVRLTSPRPKVIKLHGDFLFDDIKNTMRELESLEANTRDKLRHFASEFGFIVLGYAGNDRSVMDSLSVLLRSDSFFPHGLYWCVRQGSKLSPSVEALLDQPRFHLVEIGGFDEFFAELHNELELPLQPEMADPYGALADRLNGLISTVTRDESSQTNPIIERDIQNLSSTIQTRLSVGAQSIELVDGQYKLNIPVPYELLADAAIRRGDYDKAKEFIDRIVAGTPSVRKFELVGRLFNESGDNDVRQKLLALIAENPKFIKEHGMQLADMGLRLLANGHAPVAEQLFEASNDGHVVHSVNLAQSLLHQGKPVPDRLRHQIEHLATTPANDASALCCRIVLGDYGAAETILAKLAASPGPMLEETSSWPIMALLLDHLKDADLKKLVSDALANSPYKKASRRESRSQPGLFGVEGADSVNVSLEEPPLTAAASS